MPSGTRAARSHLQGDTAASHRAEGERMSLDDAVAYARRGRGSRDRPPAGWSALTPPRRRWPAWSSRAAPTPRSAGACSSAPTPSRSTTRALYDKLDVDGRAQLAAETVRRED